MTKLICLGPDKSYGDCATQWLNTHAFAGTAEVVSVRSNEEILASLALTTQDEERIFGIIPVYNAIEGIVAPVMRSGA